MAKEATMFALSVSAGSVDVVLSRLSDDGHIALFDEYASRTHAVAVAKRISSLTGCCVNVRRVESLDLDAVLADLAALESASA